jgi:antitoxin component of MazEF toxin-antitoxin module
MSKYTTTVIKTGNSYALRVPKAYVDDAHLKLGDKADIPLPLKSKKQDHRQVQQLWKELQNLKPFKDITDPVAWQKEVRKDRPLPGRE